jgi:hypothetical protein
MTQALITFDSWVFSPRSFLPGKVRSLLLLALFPTPRKEPSPVRFLPWQGGRVSVNAQQHLVGAVLCNSIRLPRRRSLSFFSG